MRRMHTVAESLRLTLGFDMVSCIGGFSMLHGAVVTALFDVEFSVGSFQHFVVTDALRQIALPWKSSQIHEC